MPNDFSKFSCNNDEVHNREPGTFDKALQFRWLWNSPPSNLNVLGSVRKSSNAYPLCAQVSGGEQSRRAVQARRLLQYHDNQVIAIDREPKLENSLEWSYTGLALGGRPIFEYIRAEASSWDEEHELTYFTILKCYNSKSIEYSSEWIDLLIKAKLLVIFVSCDWIKLRRILYIVFGTLSLACTAILQESLPRILEKWTEN